MRLGAIISSLFILLLLCGHQSYAGKFKFSTSKNNIHQSSFNIGDNVNDENKNSVLLTEIELDEEEDSFSAEEGHSNNSQKKYTNYNFLTIGCYGKTIHPHIAYNNFINKDFTSCNSLYCHSLYLTFCVLRI